MEPDFKWLDHQLFLGILNILHYDSLWILAIDRFDLKNSHRRVFRSQPGHALRSSENIKRWNTIGLCQVSRIHRAAWQNLRDPLNH